MWKTNLVLAFRQLVNRRVHSIINIAGLGVSLAICLSLWSYVRFETSFNSFPDADRSYVLFNSFYSVNLQSFAGYGIAPAVAEATPAIENYLRIHWSEAMVTLEDSKPREINNILFVDTAFFEFFPSKAVAGDISRSLNGPYSWVLTRSLASTMYKDPQDAIGQTVEIKNDWFTADFTITAVVEDPPANSTMQYSSLLAIEPLLKSPSYRDDPVYNNFNTFIQLRDASMLPQAQDALNAFSRRYKEGKSFSYEPGMYLQPIRENHLSHRDPRQGQNLESIYLFVTISLIVLTLAWVNFINLSTARAIERAKEVGIRKTIGVMRTQLVVQFLTESLLMNIISVGVAVVLAGLLNPVLREMTGQPVPFKFNDLPGIMIIVGLIGMGTLASGAYPALLLSSLKPVDVIKGNTAGKTSGFSLRKTLIVFQFCASSILLIGITTIVTQIDFMQGHDKGFDTNGVLVIYGPDYIGQSSSERATSFKNRVKSISTVENVSNSGVIPGGSYNSETHMEIAAHEGQAPPGENMRVVYCDMDFVPTFNVQILEGRTWDYRIESDKRAVLINEASIEPFGLKTAKDALNERVVFGSDTLQILGVVKNFYWESLKVGHHPVMFWPIENYSRRISVRINSDVDETVKKIGQIYKEYYPDSEFDYTFAEEYYNNRMYYSDKRFARIFLVFAVFAMAISCLGLFGLTLFTTQQRSKEIGIRKVLGASISNIMTLLASQFGKLFLVATIISVPVGWIVINSWLEQFPVKMSVSVWLFAVP
ncbi:MAG TPA: ABC transporter permease, partial [Cyclobacteriaceae bacterium]|nr:ABC transporter permease [Cyclobacteriaceae bacterium]